MSEPLVSDEQLAEWERLVEAATDGVWYVQRRGGSPLEVRAAWPDEDLRLASVEYLSDADFIVHAHRAVPLLLRALRDARAETDRMREFCGWLVSMDDPEAEDGWRARQSVTLMAHHPSRPGGSGCSYRTGGGPVRRVDPGRARRYMERNTAAHEEQEHARWLASLTPEHRAVHDRGFPCGECARFGLRTLARSLNALRLGSEHG